MTAPFISLGEAAAAVVEGLAERRARAVVETIPIADRASWLAWRRQDVTASVAGCLLGVHEYVTPYALWALKTGAIAEDPEETPPMRRGRLLEPVALALLREECPDWQVVAGDVYLRDAAARLGATPDAYAIDPARPGRGVIQVKTVEPSVFRRKWRDADTGEVEPPLWIAVQAIVEAHLAGAQWAAVAALTVGYGVDLHVIPTPLHAGVIERVYEAVAEFWRMVEEGRTPDPDWRRDGRLIEALYQPTGEIVDLTADNALPALCDERVALAAAKTGAETRLREIKAELLSKLGGASMARIAGGRIVTARRIDRKAYQVDATSYVDVRVRGDTTA